MTRLPVAKTYKLYVGGAFPRSESGRTYEVEGANVARASRKDLRDAVEGVHAAVIMTRWPEFGDLPRLLEDRTDPPLVIDGRRMLAPNSVARYEGIGFGPTGGRAG